MENKKVYILKKDLLLSNTGGNGQIHYSGELLTECKDRYYEFSNGNVLVKEQVENNPDWFIEKEIDKAKVMTIRVIENIVVYDILYNDGYRETLNIKRDRLADILIAESKNLLVIADSGNEFCERGFLRAWAKGDYGIKVKPNRKFTESKFTEKDILDAEERVFNDIFDESVCTPILLDGAVIYKVKGRIFNSFSEYKDYQRTKEIQGG